MNWEAVGKWALGILLVAAAIFLASVGYSLWLAYGIGNVI